MGEIESTQIMITIIVPHFNSFDKLMRLIKSIPADTESFVEVIVVDDKSDNVTSMQYDQIERALAEINGILLRNSSNCKGAGVCRNIALENARGKFLLFADADDFFIDGFTGYIKKYIKSDNDIIFFPPTSVYEGTNTQAIRHLHHEKLCKDYIKNGDSSSEIKLRYKWDSPWSKMIQTRIVKDNNIRFDETIVANDVMFSMKTSYYAKTVAVAEDIIYCITATKDTLTTKKSKEWLEVRVGVFIDRYNFLKTRLSPKEFSYLAFNGKYYLFKSIELGFGLSEAIKINSMLRRGGVDPWNIKYIFRDVHELVKHLRRTIMNRIFIEK
ncbi:glycosyltransferase family 2 protein [Butyrivibrio sp. MC2013]|uniref:glycosyltransferase family 2 protein n=1 Tax=Butyrivibrio sp. MC2013 TaxID=1280686 RepID=UPI000407341F|nr:glycosyltransferase family 2 protein [Butyrivibrio sp. MC2013]